MGMYVYGKKPKSEEGKYFRNNVWWWHPLWEYCELVAPELTAKVKHGHTNDGDGLGARDSSRLAAKLRKELESGRTRTHAAHREDRMAAIPNERCELCNATGKRMPPPHAGAGDLLCNGCDGKGSRRPFATWYEFSEENVVEFAAFLEGCGGFKIC